MSTVRANSILDSSGGNTAQINGMTPTAQSLQGFRNRIINGDMRIDQRNAGASFTSNGLFYCLDRWLLQAVGATNSAQQVTGSTGNNRAVRITGNTGNTLTGFSQRIESWNILDLAGQAVTLSFTLSGSASGSVSIRRVYPTAVDNYSSTTEPASGVSVSFSTTPTRYSVTFTLDSNANKGLWLYFDFGGVGSGVTRTLEEVQLEAGSVATPFERRDYGRELAMCQRYYIRFQSAYWASGYGDTTNKVGFAISLPVSMRAQPSVANDADTHGIIANGSLYNVTANSATIDNSWWNGSSGVVFITTNAQVTRWTTAWGRVGANLQLNAEL